MATTMVEMVVVKDQDRGLFHVAEHDPVLAPGLSRLLLATPTHTRDANTVDHLARLARSVEFFRQFPDHIVRGLCQVMTLQRKTAGQVVFRQGAPGDAFYVILTGCVRVVVDPRHGGMGLKRPEAGAEGRMKLAAKTDVRPMVRIDSFIRNNEKLSGGPRRGSQFGRVVGTMCTCAAAL